MRTWLLPVLLGLTSWGSLTPGADPRPAAPPTSRYARTASYRRVFSPCVYVAHKNIEAVLQLTDSQRADLAQAHSETVDSPVLTDLRFHAQSEGTDSAKNDYRDAVARAEAELDIRIQTILTPAQRELRSRLNAAVAGLPNDSSRSCHELLMARVKQRVPLLTPAEREKLTKDLQQRLADVLTPRQQELLRGGTAVK